MTGCEPLPKAAALSRDYKFYDCTIHLGLGGGGCWETENGEKIKTFILQERIMGLTSWLSSYVEREMSRLIRI